MNFVNNWLTQLTAGIAADATSLQIPGEALALLPNGEYVLTLSGSLNAVDAAPVEIVSVQVSGGGTVMVRAQEGTAARDWPAGAYVYCAMTAGTANKLAALLGAGSGSGGPFRSPIFTDNHLVVSLDQPSIAWSIFTDSSNPYLITFPPSPADIGVRLEVLLINDGSGEQTIPFGPGSAYVALPGGALVAAGNTITQYDLLGVNGAYFVVNRLVSTLAPTGPPTIPG